MSRDFSFLITNLGKTEFGTPPAEDSTTNYDTRRTIVEITGSDGSVAMAQVDRNKNSYTVDLLSSSKYPAVGRAGVTHTIKSTTSTITGTKTTDDNGGGGEDPDDPDTPTAPYSGNVILNAPLTERLVDTSTNIFGSSETNNFSASFLNTSDGSSVSSGNFTTNGLEITTDQRLVYTFGYSLNVLNWSAYTVLNFKIKVVEITQAAWLLTDEAAEVGIVVEKDNGYLIFNIADFPYRNVSNANTIVPETTDGVYDIAVVKRGYAMFLVINGVTSSYAYRQASPIGMNLSFNASYVWSSYMSRMSFFLKSVVMYEMDKIDFTRPLPNAQFIFNDNSTWKISYTSSGQADLNSPGMTLTTLDYSSANLPAPIIDVIPFAGLSSEMLNKYWFIMMSREKFAIGVSTGLGVPEIKAEYTFDSANASGHKFHYSKMTHSSGDIYWLFEVFAEREQGAINAAQGAMWVMRESDPYGFWAPRTDILTNAYNRNTAPKTDGYPNTIPTRNVCMKEFSDGVAVYELLCYRESDTNTDKIKLINHRVVPNSEILKVSEMELTAWQSGNFNYSAIALGFQDKHLHIVVGKNTYARCDSTQEIYTLTMSTLTSSEQILSTDNGDDNSLGQQFTSMKYLLCSDWAGFSASEAKWPEMSYYTDLFKGQLVVNSRNGVGSLIALVKPDDSVTGEALWKTNFVGDLQNIYQRTPNYINNVYSYGGDMIEYRSNQYSKFMFTNGYFDGTSGPCIGEIIHSMPSSAIERYPDVYFPGRYIAHTPAGTWTPPTFVRKIVDRAPVSITSV